MLSYLILRSLQNNRGWILDKYIGRRKGIHTKKSLKTYLFMMKGRKIDRT